MHNLPLLQQPPFCFIQSLEYWDKQSGLTGFTISPTTIFVDNGILMAAGVMENIAQSCAALIGQLALDRGDEIHMMPLCAVKKMYVHRFPRVGECLQTRVNIVDLDYGIYLMEVSVSVKDELIATAEVKVGA